MLEIPHARTKHKHCGFIKLRTNHTDWWHNTKFDAKISNVNVINGPNRAGDIPHSHASVDKAKELLNYNPQFSLQKGLKEAVKWYWQNLE